MARINDLKNVLTKRNWKMFQGQVLKHELENISQIIQDTEYDNLQDPTKKSIVQLLDSAAKLIDKPNNNKNKTEFSKAIDGWKDMAQDDRNVFSALRDPVRNLVQHVNENTK